MNNSDRLIRFDWAMKSILRAKANFDILAGLKPDRLLESESNQDKQWQKFNRVDILVKDSEDRRFIPESLTTVRYVRPACR